MTEEELKKWEEKMYLNTYYSAHGSNVFILGDVNIAKAITKEGRKNLRKVKKAIKNMKNNLNKNL